MSYVKRNYYLHAKLKFFSELCLFSIIEAIFISLWAACQWLMDYIIKRCDLTTIDHWIIVLIKLLFAISTLAPIIIHTIYDIKVFLAKAKKEMQDEETENTVKL